MRFFRALAFFAVLGASQSSPAAPDQAGASSLPQSAGRPVVRTPKQARTRKTLSDCKTELRAKGGGWCEMRVQGRHPGISSVYYPLIKGDAMDERIRGWTGQVSILGAWCGAAFDRNNLIFYFNCGGHADYGGNEWYSFDLEAGKWERLTEPSLLNYLFAVPLKKNGVMGYWWQPDIRVIPSPAHTYDGLLYRQVTGTIYYMSMKQYDAKRARNLTVQERRPVAEGGLVIGGGFVGQYEFNPSKTEKRNGLNPLSWRRV
ncbi:MAG: hypothetical protein HOK82_01835, partial [Rhodospirillaceae bacterium]|nr:hypothetical protein [Rhodospirillaceae bacterium]